MGDTENRSNSMDNSSSSSDELAAVEKKMKVDDGSTTVEIVEKSSSEVISSTSTTEETANQNSNGKSKLEESESSCSSSVQVEVDDASDATKTKLVPDEDQEMAEVTTTVTDVVEKTDLTVPDVSVKPEEEDEGELVDLKVIYNKKPLEIRIPLSKTVGDLKVLIEKQTKVTPALQKVLIKGISKDESTLQSLGVTKSTKILVIGSCLSDVMSVAKPPDKETLAAEETIANKQSNNWCTLPQHKKVIDKGVPDDAMPGILGENEPLPDIPLFGMLSTKGAKVRLTFKLELDELWIGTKERTDKVPIGTIRNVESQPIIGYEHYHILAIQLGPTEASRFFVYWVPAQYVDAIKDAVAN